MTTETNFCPFFHSQIGENETLEIEGGNIRVDFSPLRTPEEPQLPSCVAAEAVFSLWRQAVGNGLEAPCGVCQRFVQGTKTRSIARNIPRPPMPTI